MTDSMTPLIRQLHDADGDRARAGILLAMPDTLVLKYSAVLADACARAQFSAGADFVGLRIGAMRAVRGDDGNLPPHIAEDLDNFRRALAAFAAGEGVAA